MLYDKRWDKQTKSDPFNLESLIAWLEKQPADQEYNYADCVGECLYGQFMQAMGVPWSEARYLGGNPLYTPLRRWLYEHIARPAPHTFGAALTRARAALPLSQRDEK